MALRGKLEEIKSGKIAQAEAAAHEAALSEQEKAKQEEDNFLAAHTRKNTLAEAASSIQSARGDTRQALGRRKEEFRNITGLMDQIQAEDPTQELPSFKEVIADPEEGSDEEKYIQSKEEVAAAIAELRKQKEALKELGVDADGLNDNELVQAVKKAQEDADVAIREFLIQHPKSELPEALQERQEMIVAIEQRIQSLQSEMARHTAWGKEHVTPHISGWDEKPEGLPEQIRGSIASDQGWIDREQAQLVQTSLYKDLLEGVGIMDDPEVKRTYEPSVRAHREVRALEEELEAIKRKPTSKLFGYTEKKKQDEITEKERELGPKREEAERNSAAYHEAGRKYTERRRKFEEIFRSSGGKKGGYEETKKKLETSIQEIGERMKKRRQELETATYYAERRRTLMNDLEAQSQELALLKGDASRSGG